MNVRIYVSQSMIWMCRILLRIYYNIMSVTRGIIMKWIHPYRNSLIHSFHENQTLKKIAFIRILSFMDISIALDMRWVQRSNFNNPIISWNPVSEQNRIHPDLILNDEEMRWYKLLRIPRESNVLCSIQGVP